MIKIINGVAYQLTEITVNGIYEENCEDDFIIPIDDARRAVIERIMDCSSKLEHAIQNDGIVKIESGNYYLSNGSCFVSVSYETLISLRDVINKDIKKGVENYCITDLDKFKIEQLDQLMKSLVMFYKTWNERIAIVHEKMVEKICTNIKQKTIK